MLIVPSVYATVLAIKDDHYSETQKFLVVSLCWLLPLIGPAVAIAAYRSSNPIRSRNTKNDDLNRPDRDYRFIPGSTNYEGGEGGRGDGD